MISDQEKIEVYESFLHQLCMYAQTLNNHKATAQLIANACSWSRAGRIGNGMLTEKEEEGIRERAFYRLLDVDNL